MKILILVLLVLMLTGLLIFIWPGFFGFGKQELVACTMEAKLCPDGSYVGRGGPNCEFVPCPTAGVGIPTATPDDNSPRTFTDPEQKISFQYQPHLSTTYISAQEWPPKITVMAGTFSCRQGQAKDKAGRSVAVQLHTVGDRRYCVSSASEGAAGSTYTDYLYTTQQGSRLLSIIFTLRYPQCMNYDEPRRSACQQEQKTFNVDDLVDRVATSVQFQ